MKKPIVAVITLLVAVTAALAIRWLAFPDGPAQPGTVQVSPAGAPTLTGTAQALAAAANRHMPTGSRLIRVRGDMGDDPAKRIYVIIDYEISGRVVSLGLEPNTEYSWLADYVSPNPDTGDTVDIRPVGGTKVALVHSGGDDITAVSVQRADQTVTLWVRPSSGASDLPVSFETLASMATDPLVGLKTSRQMLDLGKDIDVTPM